MLSKINPYSKSIQTNSSNSADIRSQIEQRSIPLAASHFEVRGPTEFLLHQRPFLSRPELVLLVKSVEGLPEAVSKLRQFSQQVQFMTRCNGYRNQSQTEGYEIYAKCVLVSNLGPVLQC